MGEFNSDDHYIYYCGQESLRRRRVGIIVNKRVRNAVLGCSLKNDRMISVRFQGKPFNITVIQVYAPASNAEEAEVERFCCRKGEPLPGPETGLLSKTQKWIVRGDICADKARDFIGKGYPGGEQQGKGTQENCSAAWLTVSGFMVMGLVSGWPLANHSNSESFLVAHASLSQDGC